MPLEDNKGKVSVSTLKEKRASVLVNNGVVTDLELNENSKRPVANAIITENLQMIADQVNENLENIDQLLEDTKSLLNDISDLKEALAAETNRAKQNELLLTNALDEKDSDFENSLSTIRSSVNQNWADIQNLSTSITNNKEYIEQVHSLLGTEVTRAKKEEAELDNQLNNTKIELSNVKEKLFAIPTIPSEDGTYMLKVDVDNNTYTYQWLSMPRPEQRTTYQLRVKPDVVGYNETTEKHLYYYYYDWVKVS